MYVLFNFPRGLLPSQSDHLIVHKGWSLRRELAIGPIRGFLFSVLNRLFNFARVCPNQRVLPTLLIALPDKIVSTPSIQQ